MADLFEQPSDATPLAPEELRGLIPSGIAFRHELNRAELVNVTRGMEWALARRREVLNERFLRQLHQRMFGDVWRWAGKYRTTERNLGIPYFEIPVALRLLLEDAQAWIQPHSYSADEIAVRFHHGLVQIHPFPNGNGRHSRMMADLLVMELRREPFSWGGASRHDAGELRRRYIGALRAADAHDLAPLIAFARA
jgi:Fic-DOC domain mobile mystery protein B